MSSTQTHIAFIREDECIGCAKCIKACDDQAILGARKFMHTILTSLCTGCEDCIAPCPVDCIEMVEKPASLAIQSHHNKTSALNPDKVEPIKPSTNATDKKAAIAAALARVKAKKAQGDAKHEPAKTPSNL